MDCAQSLIRYIYQIIGGSRKEKGALYPDEYDRLVVDQEPFKVKIVLDDNEKECNQLTNYRVIKKAKMLDIQSLDEFMEKGTAAKANMLSDCEIQMVYKKIIDSGAAMTTVNKQKKRINYLLHKQDNASSIDEGDFRETIVDLPQCPSNTIEKTITPSPGDTQKSLIAF